MADGAESAQGNEPPAQPKSGEHDQAFFLKLAAKGKDEWNKWQRDPANKYVYVTFAGTDFSQPPRDEINFAGFEFGDGADFSGCKWRGVEWADIRPDPKTFAPGRAFFLGATFGDETNFSRAAFGGYALFSGTTFGHVVHFTHTAFGGCADFTDAAFGDYAFFYNATFGYYATFVGASFDHIAKFDDTVFSGRVEFTGKSKEERTKGLANMLENGGIERPAILDARAALEKRYKESGPDRFLTISFKNACFGVDAYLEGEAVFSHRSFEHTADFTNARFYYPPIFDAVSNPGHIDFTSAHIRFVPPPVNSFIGPTTAKL